MLSAETSSSLLWNIPLAFLVVGAVHWASTQIDFRMRTEPEERRQRRTSSPLPCAPVRQQPPRISASGKGGEREEWRAMVGAPVVESAWEKLMNNIMQEVTMHRFPAPPNAPRISSSVMDKQERCLGEEIRGGLGRRYVAQRSERR